MNDSTYHHGDLKRTLVSAAREQIAQAGAESLNLRALARTLGITHPAVYRHFADKEALLHAVAEQGFEEFAAALGTTLEEEFTDYESKVRAVVAAYIDFAVMHPELIHVMFTLVSQQAREQNESLGVAAKKAYVVLLDSVAEARGDAGINSTLMWALCHGLAELTINRQLAILDDPSIREAVIAKAAQMLSAGLGH